MDKDLLRLVILGMGGVLIVGILLWGILANRKPRTPVSFYDQRNPLDNIDESLVVKTGDDDFDIVPLGPAAIEDNDVFEFNDDAALDFDEIDLQPETDDISPAIIQFSIIAKTDLGFKGTDLVAAFTAVGLQFTDFHIFQRLDINGLPEYAVASMVEPGTFPEHDLDNFHCPGIVFFMQPSELDEPVGIYDHMLASINHLASMLDGIELGGDRQPLTTEIAQTIRNTLLA
jgi:cell division protein ZipA